VGNWVLVKWRLNGLCGIDLVKELIRNGFGFGGRIYLDLKGEKSRKICAWACGERAFEIRRGDICRVSKIRSEKLM